MILGSAWTLPAQERAAAIAPPDLAVPQLLSPTDVARGLRLRLEAMAADDADRQARRAEEAPRDYALPEGGAYAPAPPDAPGGEAEIERAGGGE